MRQQRGRMMVIAAIVASSVPAMAQQPKPAQLAYGEPVTCLEAGDGAVLRVQVDDKAKRVLVARSTLSRRGVPSKVIARELGDCTVGEPGMLERLQAEGYTVVEALLEAPPGYKRDPDGTLYQVSFDLRRRLMIGIYDGLVSGDPSFFGDLTHSLTAELGASYEWYDADKKRRHRFRFLEGRLRLTPFEVDVLALSYDQGRSGVEPTLWLTTFLGEPRRFDIDLRLAPGARLGEISVREFDQGTQVLSHLLQGHLNWEPLHGAGLEDYVTFRLGGGMGVRSFDDGRQPPPDAVPQPQASLYFFPFAGFEAAWVIDSYGRTQMRVQGDARMGWEPRDARLWTEARITMSFERVILALTDQPITLFVAPEVRFQNIEPIGNFGEVRLNLGGRLNLFVPPRPDYAAVAQEASR